MILVAVGWFAGSNAPGTAIRRAVSGDLEKGGAVLADGPVGGAGRCVAANAMWLRVAVGLLGTVVLLCGNDVSVSRLLWSMVLVAVLLAVEQVMVGAGRATGATGRAPAADTGALTRDP